jgi:hypothetical protein
MKRSIPIICFFIVLLISCQEQKKNSVFTFNDDGQGVELKENGQPVFYYQKMPKSLTGEYICNNYLHPLYNLQGDTITEEFPEDHPYHRGIFWAWHQVYVNEKKVGDGWIMKDIENEIVDVETLTKNNSGLLKLNVLWKSHLFENGKPFLSETTTIIVYPRENDIRKIDFTIALKALVPGVKIGGSNDKKGYGGFCARLKCPTDLTFTSANRIIVPTNLQIKADPWMDFSASFSKNNKKSGVSILCHPETPNYPAPWIIRARRSMQNIVFPGQKPIGIPTDKPVFLHYRLVIHNGDANSIDLAKLQSEFEKSTVTR